MPAALVVLAVVGVTACATDSSDQAGRTIVTPATGSCPTSPVPIVVTVDQWGDIVGQLAGACGEVTTIIQGSSGDPHDYEPTPADSAAFSDARLVVMNGLGYDQWAQDALDAVSVEPVVVNAGEVAELNEGDNPHIWYGPRYVALVAATVTNELQVLAPEAADYFRTQSDAWQREFGSYTERIETIRVAHAGTPYAATESVFDYMAEALGLQDVTPRGYRSTAANESEPAPGDLRDFEDVLTRGAARVLMFNTQTEGAVTEQLREVAESAEVPVVEITETPPSGSSFVAWQIGQLQALEQVLD